MTTYDVPREKWREFFDQFSRLHQGQEARIESRTKQCAESHANARGVPFVGVTAQGDKVNVVVGTDAANAGGVVLDHAIGRPVRVKVSEWNDAVSAQLEIESADGWVTSVQVGPEKEILPEGFITDGLMDTRPN